jgi:hypothetical protein
MSSTDPSKAELSEMRSVLEQTKAVVSDARASVDQAVSGTPAPGREQAPALPRTASTEASAPPVPAASQPAAEAVTTTVNGTGPAPIETRPWAWDTAGSMRDAWTRLVEAQRASTSDILNC